MEPGSFPIALRNIIEWRGTDITLTEKEKLIDDAIIKEGSMLGNLEKLTEYYPEGD